MSPRGDEPRSFLPTRQVYLNAVAGSFRGNYCHYDGYHDETHKESSVLPKTGENTSPSKHIYRASNQPYSIITITVITLLILLISFGVIDLPLPRETSYYFLGFLSTIMLCSPLSLRSLENSVTEHNEWLRRMSPSPDSVDGE